MAERRSSYDASFKLKVIDLAKKSNNCAASRKYGVTEKMVREWQKRKMPRKYSKEQMRDAIRRSVLARTRKLP
ncbi:hypothetical protein M514_17468 [Trichuris suis]|uniref:Brinker DNA-binding domain-containing protein n=1 Tax=Trichuris suis TaxID=68888 RepID=A0A085NLN8_9BILA|nr:hypothetical protein M514_17468 [Trichuris suis]